jgi:hypothetical protein
VQMTNNCGQTVFCGVNCAGGAHCCGDPQGCTTSACF